jgi:hypothetical protein
MLTANFALTVCRLLFLLRNSSKCISSRQMGRFANATNCRGELAEPDEVRECLRKFPNWKPSPECTCDFSKGVIEANEWVQDFRSKVTGHWLDAVTTDPWMQNIIQIAGRIKPENRTEFGAILTAEGNQDESSDDYRRIDAVDFPKSAHKNAFYGIAGEVVETICDGSELKPEAVLSQFLCIFGNLLGRSIYKEQEGRHGTLINVAIIGSTAAGAKGGPLQGVKRMFKQVDFDYTLDNVKGGYNSSEALLADITDEVGEYNKKGEYVITLEAVPDKRLLVVEEEFSRILQIGKRDGCTMSEILRQCYDLPDKLRAPSRKSNLVSTNPFVSIIGHITPEGLKKSMPDVEAFNGFPNRFMFIASRRTKPVPEPPVIDWTEGKPADIVLRLKEALRIYRPHPKNCVQNPDISFRFSDTAKKRWSQIYHEICTQSASKSGFAGAVIARAKPTILRLSMIYAALDRTPVIDPKHLDAAVALWDYSTLSAVWAFEGMSGSVNATKILKSLRRYPEGENRTTIAEWVFRKNISGAELTEALSELHSAGLARMEKNGKEEVWYPV